jgi:hypothetical protein
MAFRSRFLLFSHTSARPQVSDSKLSSIAFVNEPVHQREQIHRLCSGDVPTQCSCDWRPLSFNKRTSRMHPGGIVDV